MEYIVVGVVVAAAAVVVFVDVAVVVIDIDVVDSWFDDCLNSACHNSTPMDFGCNDVVVVAVDNAVDDDTDGGGHLVEEVLYIWDLKPYLHYSITDCSAMNY
jgi:hypothetical protein